MRCTIVAGVHSRSSDWPPRDNGDRRTTGEAARLSGFSIETLRYYEREGLLPPVARDESGRRSYSDIDLGWLALVRCLRETGMGVVEIRRFVELTQGGVGTTDQRIAMLEAHDGHIDRQIDQLRRHQTYLREKLDFYRSREGKPS